MYITVCVRVLTYVHYIAVCVYVCVSVRIVFKYTHAKCVDVYAMRIVVHIQYIMYIIAMCVCYITYTV